MSRETTLNQTANDSINQIMNSIDVLNARYYYDIDHSATGCFYYPEIDSSTAVTFRGECDMDIPVVQNFDAVAVSILCEYSCVVILILVSTSGLTFIILLFQYMGLWHDVESYPDPFQDGTCNNAFYTLIDGVVDVFNTQVINQTLDTIRGTAVITSTDGSAKLEATFNIMGFNGKITTFIECNIPSLCNSKQ